MYSGMTMESWKGTRVGQGNVSEAANHGQEPCHGIDLRPTASALTATPFVSVIVPVRNEARFIERTIQQLLGQDYPANRFEILVVDGQSSDLTRSLVEARAEGCLNLHLVENPRFLSSAARNIGIQQARGSMIVIVDGHCDIENGTYLRDLVDAFERSGADCLERFTIELHTDRLVRTSRGYLEWSLCSAPHQWLRRASPGTAPRLDGGTL